MSTIFASSSRMGLRPLSQPASRLFTSSSRIRSAAATAPMSTSALFATAALAVGAYALYARQRPAAQAETAGGAPAFGGFGPRTLTLASTESVNHNVKRLRFDLGDPQTPTGLTLTSAVLAISFPGGSWLPVLRPYTPVEIDQTGRLDLLVKLYPGGKQSTHLHSLKPGDSLTLLRIPGYRWNTNEQKHIGLIAGGQGITPCYQLLRGLLLDPRETTRITLVWGVNTEADLFLRDELTQLARDHPGRLKTVYVVSKPTTSEAGFATGHVTGELLKNAGILPGDGKDGVGKVFLSGPPPMEEALKGRGGVLEALGFTKKQLRAF